MKRVLGWRWMLLPLTPLYRLGLWVRAQMLGWGLEPVRRLNFPVVSIGNLSTGGSGKTPLAIALVQLMVKRGVSVDVLSRGYGRESVQTERVRKDGSAAEFGDEPLLIARQTEVPVYVSPMRVQAGMMAESEFANEELARKAEYDRAQKEWEAAVTRWEEARKAAMGLPEEASADSTGAPQPAKDEAHEAAKHLPESDAQQQGEGTTAVAEEETPSAEVPERPDAPPPFEIRQLVHLLDDGFQHRQLKRQIDIVLLNMEDWQDRLLPAGNLREPIEALNRASLICIPAEEVALEKALRSWGWQGPTWKLKRKMVVPPVKGPVAALCGIARPERFTDGLAALNVPLVACYTFPDHYAFTAEILESVIEEARMAHATAVLTTEKDMARLGPLIELFPKTMPLKPVPLKVEIADEAVAMDWLMDRLGIHTHARRM